MDKFTLKTQSRKQRMTVPRIQKSGGDSNSLSFAFTLPVQHRTIPWKSNAWKKQFNSPGRNLTVLKNIKQRVRGFQNGYKQQMQRLGRNRTLEMVGQPLTLNAQLKGGNQIHSGVGVALLHSPIGRFGATTGSSSGRPKIDWKQSPRNNYNNKGISLIKELKHVTALRENTPLDEEIIVMGAPLVFTKESNQVTYISKHIDKGGNASYALHNSQTTKEDMYNASSGEFLQIPNTSGQMLGAQKTNSSLDRVDFDNKTTVQNDTEFISSQSHKNNRTDNYFAEDFNNQGNNLLVNQSTTSQNIESQAGNQEKTSENGTVEISSHFLHNNDNLQYPNAATFDKEAPKQSGSQLQSIEQNQTDVFYEYGQQSNEINRLDGSATNVTNYQENITKELHDSEVNNALDTDQIRNEEENLPPFPEESIKEEDLDNSQSVSDDNSNLDKDRGEVNEEDQFGENPVIPASNQRYMPVDEFGSPFYGNETGKRLSKF